jgi:hypothetical protein
VLAASVRELSTTETNTRSAVVMKKLIYTDVTFKHNKTYLTHNMIFENNTAMKEN